MKKLDYEKLNTFIASDIIRPFYEIRLDRLKLAKISIIARRKNPYLFKAKNIETSGDLAKSMLDAFLSLSRFLLRSSWGLPITFYFI